MTTAKYSLTKAAAFAVLLGTVALAAPSFAAPVDPTAPAGPPNSTVNLDANGHVLSSTPDTSMQGGGVSLQGNGAGTQTTAPTYHHHHDHAVAQPAAAQPDSDQGMTEDHHMKMHKGMHGPEEMRQHVEERIKTLHAKLMVTPEQEAQWSDVAQAMRDSEANVSSLIQERHKNAGSMNAVDDLESYQTIAQAHADGLKQVNAAFKNLYATMSDAQKKNADTVFDHYEGHGPEGKPMHHHHKHNKTSK